MKGLIDQVVDFATGLRRATASAHDLIAEQRARITALRAELQHTERGPRPPAEVIEAFNTWVSETAAYQAKEYGSGLVVQRFGAPTKDTHTGAPWGPGTTVQWGFLCLFASDLLKRSFADLVRATDYTPGPPMAERPALVERLRADLAALEAEDEQLVDEAASAGVAIEHRPEVLTRREQEARRRELAEREEAGRRAREAALDAKHATQTAGARSPYLDRERAR